MMRRIAAIDIGTVTTRLLVADVGDGAIREVERSTDITHLGNGLTATGRLDPGAMERVAGVIGGYAARIADLGVERVRAVATSASRDASNSDRFLELLDERGVRPEIIAGSREAELAFAGATFGREGDGLLVVDCGGGSTELVLGDAGGAGTGGEGAGGAIDPRIRAARSIDVGSRRMTERLLASDPPTPGELEDARAWATAELRPFFDRLDARPLEMIGLAGTATSLVAIKLGLATYDSDRVHGQVLSGAELAELLGMLASIPIQRRREVVGLHPERAGVIVAGALIFETVLALSGLSQMSVSEHDILYGILIDAYRARETEA